MRPLTLFLSFGLALGLLAFAQQPRAKPAKGKKPVVAAFGNSDAITEQELKIYDYFLASDQLEGRNLPSRGFDTAALYVASELASWGIKPGGSTTGTNGPLQPYFMPFELVAKLVIPNESKASITGGRGGRQGQGERGADGPPTGGEGPFPGRRGPSTFEYGKDWAVLAGRGAPPVDAFDVNAAAVFAGNGYVVNKTKLNPFEGLDVKGKIVVVAGLPAEIRAQQGRPGGGGGGASPLGENCTDFLTPEQAAAKNGAVAVVKVATFQQLSAPGGPFSGFGAAGTVGGPVGPNGPAYRVAKFQANSECPSVPSLTIGLAMTSALFAGEKQTGEQIFSGAESTAKQDSFALTAEKKISLHVAVKSEPNHAENVVGMVEGCDPALKNEYVVMSAHLDHIGLSNGPEGSDNINNGADDDGSGSTALLAIAKAYAEGAAKGMSPKRSIIFLWNAGEEKGLWGSQYFAEFPPVDITKIVADLNIDMIGRTMGPDFKDSNATHVLVKPNDILVVGPNISSNDLEQTIETTNAAYQKIGLNHFYDVTAPDKDHDNLGPQPRGQRIFYRSDHYNFAKIGVPIAFFTTGLHPDYHRPTDSPEKLDYKEMVVVSKTISAVGWVLANQNGRPQINAKLPDQLVKDMKLAKDQGWGKTTPVIAPLPNEPF
jgi:hypothetical protein